MQDDMDKVVEMKVNLRKDYKERKQELIEKT